MRLLNVRYKVTRGEQSGARLVYVHDGWNVYEDVSCCPRAWVLHEVTVEPSFEETKSRMEGEEFDPLRAAFLSEPLAEPLDPEPPIPARIVFGEYRGDRFELDVSTQSAGLLVVSEMYYPGWLATVNTAPARIYKADGLLRGVVVPKGENRVVFEYRPRSVLIGAWLSGVAFAGTLIFAAVLLLRRRADRSEPRP